MHVVTKIFIVLVSLLTVLLVPLVVVYAYNENSFQARYQQSEDLATSYRTKLEAAEAGFGAALARSDTKIQDRDSEIRELRRSINERVADVQELETRLAEATTRSTEIDSRLSTLANSVEANQELTQSLIDELRGLRREALAAERQKVELDEALREALANLDVAIAARRGLQEELQRMKEEHAKSLDKIGQYVTRFGELGREDVLTGVVADQDLDTTVIRVIRNSQQVVAEIDAGSRDGVKIGWTGTIGRGGNFLGTLRIIDVDINRSTGVVELENELTRGRVDVTDRVLFRSGR